MRIWNDCSGGVFSTELLLITSVVLAGLTAGLTNYRDALNSELADMAAAVQQLNQSFSFTGVESRSVRTAGSDYTDALDPLPFVSAQCVVLQSSE